MNRIQLYKKTVDILYNAYFNGTLFHGNCQSCAVGNLVAANMGTRFILTSMGRTRWDKPIKMDNNGFLINWINGIRFPPVLTAGEGLEVAQKEIDSTGYSREELGKIEKAFEGAISYAPPKKSREEWLFLSLEAVLEELKEIHEITDENDIYCHSQNVERFSSHRHHKQLQAI